jgi:hypothetical protein
VLVFPKDTARSADMFAPPRDVVEWYDSSDWCVLTLKDDPGRRHVQGVCHSRTYQQKMKDAEAEKEQADLPSWRHSEW